MKVKLKIWIEDDNGDCIFSDGRLVLLTAIRETGSLSAAAEKLGISYRHAWGQIRKIEKRIGSPIMKRSVGGKAGGGSVLTASMKKFVEKYSSNRRAVEKYAEDRMGGLKIK